MTQKPRFGLGTIFVSGHECAFLVMALATAADGFEHQGCEDFAFADRAPDSSGDVATEIEGAQRAMQAKGKGSAALAVAINDALVRSDADGRVHAIDLGKLNAAVELFVDLREIETRALPLFQKLAARALAAVDPASRA